MERQVVGTRKYKAGYEIRTERVSYSDEDPPVVLKSAYTIPDGHYIGPSRRAHRLIVKHGIKPEPREPACPESNGGSGRTCSIGFSEREQKWYGWSHRAMWGFSVGDCVDSKDHLCSQSGWIDEYLEEHPEADQSLPVGFEAKNIEDAKRMAIAFAESVS